MVSEATAHADGGQGHISTDHIGDAQAGLCPRTGKQLTDSGTRITLAECTVA